jgi:hypothetical protein
MDCVIFRNGSLYDGGPFTLPQARQHVVILSEDNHGDVWSVRSAEDPGEEWFRRQVHVKSLADEYRRRCVDRLINQLHDVSAQTRVTMAPGLKPFAGCEDELSSAIAAVSNLLNAWKIVVAEARSGPDKLTEPLEF